MEMLFPGQRQPQVEDFSPKSSSVLLLYLGRRGAMSRFALEAMHAASTLPDLNICLCISRQNENFEAYSHFDRELIAVDTFESNLGALLCSWRAPLIGRRLMEEISQRQVTSVVDLMPHVWSPYIARLVHKAGARYLAIAHDAEAHPGDTTGLIKGVTDLALRQADVVIALSRPVAMDLQRTQKVTRQRLETLFHPVLSYVAPRQTMRRPDQPIRLLFFGRIMPYKGLPLFVDMIEILQRRAVCVEIGVFGEGNLGSEEPRLSALGAEVVNHWLSDSEIAAMFERYDLVVASHVQASQSGVVAAAFGAGLPVVATPVGGLPGQVTHGVDGLVASEVSAKALSDAVEQISLREGLYETLRLGVREQMSEYSMQRFIREIARLSRE